MMIKKILFCTLVFILVGNNALFAQKNLAFGDNTKKERATAIVTLPNNGGFIVAGNRETLSPNALRSDVYIRRVDSNLSYALVWQDLIVTDAQATTLIASPNPSFYYLAGEEGNTPHSFIYTINSSNGQSNNKFTTTDSSKISAGYKAADGTTWFVGYKKHRTFIGANPIDTIVVTKPFVFTFNGSEINSIVTIPSSIPPFSEATAITQTNNQRTWVAGNNETLGAFLWNIADSTVQWIDPTASESVASFLVSDASKTTMYLGVQKEGKTQLLHYNQTGNLLKQLSLNVQYEAAVAMGDTGIICTGISDNKIVTTFFDTNFNVKWSKITQYKENSYTGAFAIDTIPNGVVLAGATGGGDETDDFFVGTLTNIKQKVAGKVYVVANCGDTPSVPLSNWIIKGTVESTQKSYYAVTDSIGNYQIELDTVSAGTITIEAANQVGFSTCQKAVTTISNGILTNMPPLLVLGSDTFPFLIVDISTAYLRLNDTIDYVVRVQNPRSVPVANAQVLSSFAPELAAIAPQTGNTVTTLLGTIKANSDTLFTIKRYLTDAAFDPIKTYCAEAKVLPDTSSLKQPRLSIKGECLSDSVRFTIENIGNSDFKGLTDRRYAIIIDELILRVGTIKNLTPNQTDILTVYKKGFSTYVLVADQGAKNPYGSFAGGRVEACGTKNATDTTALTQITYPDFDDDLTYALDCQKAVNAIPTKSQSIIQPLGYTEFVANTIPIVDDSLTFEHHHLLINSTKDTVKTAVLDVHFSKQLSPTQIEFGSYSKAHPYRVKIKEGNHLEFTFANLHLPPSANDAANAVLFVNFRIKVPLKLSDSLFTTETTVKFNEVEAPHPVDTVYREIKDGAFPLTSIELEPIVPFANIAVAPNPFSIQTMVTVEEALLGATFRLHSLQGKLVQELPIIQPNFVLSAGELAPGIYVCSVWKNGVRVAKAKKVIVVR